MPCTTILVGKKASYDGSTIIARNDDSGSGHYTSKKFAVIHPEDQPRKYRSVLSHVEIELPENPMRYTAMPNAEEGEGIWAACGVNEAHVGMTATETITSNPRVLGADPLVRYQPAKDGKEEISGEIRYAFWDTTQQPYFEKCIEKFNEQYPDVKVTLEPSSWDEYWTKLEAGATGGIIFKTE